MEIIGKKTHPKERKFYNCKSCDFNCFNKKDYNRHLQTKKHKNLSGILDKTSVIGNVKKCSICNKIYKTDSGLWKHEQKCIDIANKNKEQETIKEKEESFKKIMMEVVDKNNELQKMLLDQQKQHAKNLEEIIPKLGNITNNTTNNTKNEVNINIFLNEYCKDALNISEFVHSLQVKFDDLENTSNVGHIDGISQIFINGLKDLDMYKRPLHCSDLHKKILYVKDNDQWEKDDTKLRKAIVILNEKNLQNISNVLEENVHHNENEKYSKIISENLISEEIVNKDMEKIIKNVAKEVVIE